MRSSARSAGERRRSLRVLLAVAFFVLAGLGVAAPASADPEEHFREGMAAWDEERWADVALHMRAAIGEKSVEGGMVRLYGTRFEEYLPHFYLGLALHRLDTCADSVAALDESNRQGELGSRQRRELESALESCRGRLPATPPPPPPTPPATPPSVTPPPAETEPGPASTIPEVEEIPIPPPPAKSEEPPRPSPALRRAADAFLAGDYARALDLLDSSDPVEEPKARATTHLLRAAAGYSLYLEGGRDDQALRRAAERDALAWRADPAGIRAAAIFLSPSVRAFLDGG